MNCGKMNNTNQYYFTVGDIAVYDGPLNDEDVSLYKSSGGIVFKSFDKALDYITDKPTYSIYTIDTTLDNITESDGYLYLIEDALIMGRAYQIKEVTGKKGMYRVNGSSDEGKKVGRNRAHSEKKAEDRSLPGRYKEIYNKVQRKLKRFYKAQRSSK